MDITAFFRSVLEQDPAPIVICDTEHTIVYMNPAAARDNAGRGGESLVGKSILACHLPRVQRIIEDCLERFRAGNESDMIFLYHRDGENRDAYLVALRDAAGSLIGYYEKYEYRTPETAAPYEKAARGVHSVCKRDE